MNVAAVGLGLEGEREERGMFSMVLNVDLEKEIGLLCEIFYKNSIFFIQETVFFVIQFKNTQICGVSTSNSIEEKFYNDRNLREVLWRIQSDVYLVT